MPPTQTEKKELVRLRMVKDHEWENGDESFDLLKDQVIHVDPKTAEELVESEVAERYDEDTEKEEKEQEGKKRSELEELVRQTFTNVLKEMNADNTGDGPRVRVHGAVLEDDGLGGFKSDAHFLSEVITASKPGGRAPETLSNWQTFAEKRAKATRTKVEMQEGDDEQGGYLVPPDVGNLWMPPALEAGITTSRAFQVPMSSNRIQMPALVDDDHSTSYFGGVTIQRPGEGEQKGQSKPHMRLIELTLHKMTVLVPLTDEMIEDSPISMAAFLNQIIPKAIAFQRDADHIDGTGANMALGAINAANPALIAVAPEGGQAADTIVYENLVNMWARFKMVNKGSCCWIASHEAFPQLATMALAMGTAGVAVWMPAMGAADQPHSTLFGLPLILTEKCEVLGNQGDIGLIDWSQYYYADKGGIKRDSSIHLWFDYDKTAFRFVLRSDGQPAWQAPLTPLNGGDTLSPFVVIEART